MNELYRTYEVLIEETVPDGHEKRGKDKTKKPLLWNAEADGALRDTHMVFQDAVCYYTLLLAGLAGNQKVTDFAAPEKQTLLNPLWGHLTGALNTQTEQLIRRLTANYKLPAGIKTAQDFLEKIYSWPDTSENKGIEGLLADMKRTKELDEYGLREGTIGGWAEVRKHFIKLAKRAKEKPKWESRLPDLLVKAADKEQTAIRARQKVAQSSPPTIPTS